MDEDVCVTFEIDDEGHGHLKFELPAGTPEHEIAYFHPALDDAACATGCR